MIDELINFLKTDNIFLTGGAGVGKSYTVSKIIKHYKNENLGVVSLEMLLIPIFNAFYQ